jgi:pheromone shutdown protein TraB
MATQSHELSDHLPQENPVRDAALAVLWVCWVAVMVHEYVGNSFSFAAFMAWFLPGILLGVGVTYWLRRTSIGRRAGRLYRRAPTGRKTIFTATTALLTVVVGIYAATLLEISMVLILVGWMGGLFGKQLSDFVVIYSSAG